MIHRTYALFTTWVYTELGIGAKDAVFADFWQSAHTLLHGQQHLQSCHRSSACAALLPAAPFARATFFMNCVWVLHFQAFYLWGLTWVSSNISTERSASLHLVVALIRTWIGFTVELLIHDSSGAKRKGQTGSWYQGILKTAKQQKEGMYCWCCLPLLPWS